MEIDFNRESSFLTRVSNKIATGRPKDQNIPHVTVKSLEIV